MIVQRNAQLVAAELDGRTIDFGSKGRVFKFFSDRADLHLAVADGVHLPVSVEYSTDLVTGDQTRGQLRLWKCAEAMVAVGVGFHRMDQGLWIVPFSEPLQTRCRVGVRMRLIIDVVEQAREVPQVRVLIKMSTITFHCSRDHQRMVALILVGHVVMKQCGRCVFGWEDHGCDFEVMRTARAKLCRCMSRVFSRFFGEGDAVTIGIEFVLLGSLQSMHLVSESGFAHHAATPVIHRGG